MGLKFEKTVPEWLKSGTEPPDTLKQRGFVPGYKPPAEYFNWFWFGVSSVLQEMQEQLSNAVFGTPTVTAESTDGVTYAATVDGITELTAGLTITIIPNTASTSISAKLNLNGLGAKYIRQSTTNNTTTGLTPKNANWMAANKPITIQYDGTQWKTIAARSNASDLNGIVAIANGGTGATSAEDALENLGALPLAGGTMTGTIRASLEGLVTGVADDNAVRISGGTSWDNGASIVVCGKDHASYPGMFRIKADDATNECVLLGKPDGTLTWNGKSLLNAAMMPNYSAKVDITSTMRGNNSYTAPSDGVIIGLFNPNGAGFVMINGANIAGISETDTVYLPLEKGDVVKCSYTSHDSIGSAEKVYFIPYKG